MTEEIINQAIETTATEAPAEVAVEESVNENTEATEVVEKKASEEIVTDATSVVEDTPFPKKAVNALSRRDKQIGKLRAEQAADRAELQKLRETIEKSQVKDAPREESFDNYGDFLEAKNRHQWDKEAAEKLVEQKEAQAAQKEQAYVAEREDYATQKALDAIESIPEYKQLFTENSDVLQSLPPHVERAFLEAEEPALAFFALAKEGKLESIVNLSPARVAMEIGKAEVRGQTLSQVKQVTSAPAPIKGLKGTGQTSKNLNNMSSQELMKWAES